MQVVARGVVVGPGFAGDVAGGEGFEVVEVEAVGEGCEGVFFGLGLSRGLSCAGRSGECGFFGREGGSDRTLLLRLSRLVAG